MAVATKATAPAVSDSDAVKKEIKVAHEVAAPRQIIDLRYFVISAFVAAIATVVVFWMSPFASSPCPAAPPNMETAFCGDEFSAFVSGQNVQIVHNKIWSADPAKVQCLINKESLETLPHYAAIADAIAEDGREPDILMLGSSGGCLPFLLERVKDQYTLTVVDESSEVIELARNYTMKDDADHISYVHANEDAYLSESSDEEFDIIVNDVFVGDNQVEYMTSGMIVEEAYRVLKPNGVYMVNGMSMDDALEDVDQLADALEAVFDVVEVYEVDAETENYMVFAWKQPLSDVDDNVHSESEPEVHSESERDAHSESGPGTAEKVAAHDEGKPADETKQVGDDGAQKDL